jgi:peptidoglycan L-alanyl-D-glutamate endopeptidase CwlK
MFQLSARSRERLKGVHPDLVRVVELAIGLSMQDFSVLEGVRSRPRQAALYGQGRTRAELQERGVNPDLAQPTLPKVTWTLRSNHFAGPDGLGRAVDLVPYPVDWNDTTKFDQIAHAMLGAAERLGIDLRWGADWDMDGRPRERGESDSPHFELAP